MAKNQDNTELGQNGVQPGEDEVVKPGETPKNDEITVSRSALDAIMQSAAAAFAGAGATAAPVKKAHRVIVDKYDGDAWKKSELVTLRIDSNKYKDDLYVSVNGRRYNVQRGEEILVPEAIAEVIKESVKQDERTARMIATLAAQRRIQ